MLYKKDITIQLIIFTILLFLAMIFAFNILTKPANAIEADINKIEDNLVLQNLDEIDKNIKDIDKRWNKSEFTLRIVNTTEGVDKFEENLSQVTILTKHKNKDLLEYIAPLRDTTRLITQIIPKQ
jgi:hypothetical protein